MSKLTLIKGDSNIKIDNTTTELKQHKVMVDIQYISKLKKSGIPFTTFGDDYYIVRRGKRNKKFNQDQVNQIKNDLKTLSIRKTAEKYKCSPTIILQIKNNTY